MKLLSVAVPCYNSAEYMEKNNQKHFNRGRQSRVNNS